MLEAGDGGGGISKRSAVSLLFPPVLDLATLTLLVPLFEAKYFFGLRFLFFDEKMFNRLQLLPLPPFSTKSFKSLDVKLLGVGMELAIFADETVMILKRHVSVKSQAEFSNCPTFGTPFEMVKPIAPGWYIGLFFIHTWPPTVSSAELVLDRIGFLDFA